ncbi:hypothetical protein BBJ28_00022993 [Nothophytophthora sp. Chile5]|nr:hypothetical protein BBJ28_00022993 [Nothophytophthora sp. Chile5]
MQRNAGPEGSTGGGAAVYGGPPPQGTALDGVMASLLAEMERRNGRAAVSPSRVEQPQDEPVMAKQTGMKRKCPLNGSQRPRRRQKDDLRALQHDVAQLEARLDAAKQRNPARYQREKEAAAARRERQSEKDLEIRKARLRHFAEVQMRASERMRGYIYKCQMQTEDTPTEFGLGFGAAGCCGGERMEYEPILDAPVYRRLEESLAGQYDQLGQIFQDAGLDHEQADLDDAQVVPGGDHGAFVRFASAKIAPFELEAISTAMWRGAQKSSVLDANLTGNADSTVYLKRECLLRHDPASSEGVAILLRGICRRFVEPHRIVLLWEGTGDWPRDYMRRHPSSVPIRERGYCVIRTFHSGKGRSCVPLSLFQTCVCMTPGLSADIAMDQPEHLQMLADLVIPSYRKILDAREQMLENAILDEMVHQRTASTSRY